MPVKSIDHILPMRLFAPLAALSLLSLSVSQMLPTSAYATEPLYLYQDVIGGPYVDDWFISGHRATDAGLILQRQGKSGQWQAPVAVDCAARTLTVTGPGLRFEHSKLSKQQAQADIPTAVVSASIQALCSPQQSSAAQRPPINS
ncbi:hypothetical protein [Ferrimonas kyonanensis]|uniref:hypothetical protein n=1 Tax=Ferrimonas kyonanensis TaxID=364763 RepID=UPI000686A26E|nr:hypothetical protein [Ferrimonas kyonanensis]